MVRWIVLVSVTIASVIFTVLATKQSDLGTTSNVEILDGWEEVENDISDHSQLDVKDLKSPSQDSPTAISHNRTKKGSLILVSTLDGKLSALDEQNHGTIMWSLATGPAGLLSSSISKVELSSQGQWVRLIPSLLGGLYKFDGEAIEPIPITAETLLHSSFQLSDELIITGGRESRTYGLDARTGRLQYVCTLQGCQTTSDRVTATGEFLVIRRHTQTVRAVEPRTGVERWNFSVGHHDVVVLDSSTESFADCEEDAETARPSAASFECYLKDIVNTANRNSEDDFSESATLPESVGVELKVVVPDGIILGMDKDAPARVRWQQKFESPVVKIWRLTDGQLVELDLFNNQYQSETFPGLEQAPPPMLYVGIHNKQLYVQENTKFLSIVSLTAQQEALLGGSSLQKGLTPRPRLPWKPKNAQSLPEITGRPGRFTVPSTQTDGSRTESIVEDDSRITALVVRHEVDYPFDRGFYLYGEAANTDFMIEDKSHSASTSLPDEEEWWEGGSGTPVHVVIVSLWFWWREVVFISLFTAVLFHVLITRQVVFLLRQRWAFELQRHLVALLPRMAQAMIEKQQTQQQQRNEERQGENQEPRDCFENVVVVPTENRVVHVPSPPATPEYTSRYLTDFEPVQCLGRGGFGLVFEARNRLDDCHYAVKRIRLPNSEEAREKVMREVRALAKLDHPHIVRYFHAWLECPPPGWQEQQDLKWMDCENLTGPTPNNTGEDMTTSVTHPESLPKAVNPFKPFSSQTSSTASFDNNNFSDKSFSIVFENSRSKDERTNGSFDIIFEDSQAEAKTTNSSSSSDDNLDYPLQTSIGGSGTSTSNESSAIEDSSVMSGNIPQKITNSNRLQKKKEAPQESKMYLYIQMQLCKKDSLREWLRSHVNHRDPFQILHMFSEIVQAVEYVHLQGLMHRDLKPSNIFFAPDGSIKIGDFGLVTAMNEDVGRSPALEAAEWFSEDISLYKHTDQVGTQLYMSPEQIEGKPYNHKVDIYSLGLIFFELLWPFSTQMEQVNTLSQLRRLKFPNGFAEKHPGEYRLLRMMLSPNPDERPTTFGVRLSSPLINYQDENIQDIPDYLRFTLQRPRSTTRTSSTSSSPE